MAVCQRCWPVIRSVALGCALAITLSVPTLAENQNPKYLVRIARETSSGTSCVLLQNSGAFHYEAGEETIKVFEGTLAPDQLASVRRDLVAFRDVSQAQIEEPLIHGPRDLLDIHFFQQSSAKEILFRSSESQQRFRASLKPLVQWMDSLPKLSTRALTEDAGKQNCLPRSKIRLLKRDEVVPAPPLTRTPVAGRRITTAPAVVGITVQPLVRLELLQRTASDALQRCALMAEDGRYRFELRSQKVGRRNVENRVAKGGLSAEDLKRLQDLLEVPALARLRHHEPPASMPLNIMGAVLDLSIRRAQGFQDVTLTDNTHRNTFFYSGDGDISLAKSLMAFVQRSMESRAQPADSAGLNGCSQLP